MTEEEKNDFFCKELEPFYHELMKNALKLSSGNYHRAEDLFQDTLIKAYTKLDSFKKGTNFRAWLYRIMYYSFVNDFRRRQKFEEIMEENSTSMVVEENTVFRDRFTFKTPEDQLCFNTMDEKVVKALDNILDIFSEAIILVDIQGCSYSECAEIMDIPIGTVMSRLCRGRKLLREELYEYADSLGVIRNSKYKRVA